MHNTLKPGNILHNFTVKSIHDLPEHKSIGILLEHNSTKCEVFHMLNDDVENLFNFIFKTPPTDNTGVAHIVEHIVLCSSHKYPVKETMQYLLKGSMQTYLNASTYPDMTMYPAASTVEQDLFNIMDVYGNAVFFPRLTHDSFWQEAHHIEYTDTNEPFITGIVYNEMKGVYASHESILMQSSFASLYADGPYSYDSGGIPEHITKLTYEQFCEYHRVHYHPSHTRIFLYGNIPTERYLAFLDEQFLCHFTYLDMPQFQITPQKPQKPQNYAVAYAVHDENNNEGSSITLNWLLPPIGNKTEVLSFQLLSAILIDSISSPLQKAIVNSPLGDDLAVGSGLTSDYQLSFSVGVRGANKEDADKVQKLIFDTLHSCVKNGLDAELIESCIRNFEFYQRELKHIPGLRFAKKSAQWWIHGFNPVENLIFIEPFEAIKHALHANPRYFEDMIQKYFLNNEHYTQVTVYPSTHEHTALIEQEKQNALTIARNLNQQQYQQQMQAFTAYRNSEDTPEQIATIPRLSRNDIPKKIRQLTVEHTTIHNVPVLFQKEHTNGIDYIAFAFDISHLSLEELRLVQLLSACFSNIDTNKHNYESLSNMLATYTGGITADVVLNTTIDKRYQVHFYIRFKALHSLMPHALPLLHEIIHHTQLTNEKRITEIFTELYNDIRSAIIPYGHLFVKARVNKNISVTQYLADALDALGQYHFLANIQKNKTHAQLPQQLQALCAKIFSQSNLTMSITSDVLIHETHKKELHALITALPNIPYTRIEHTLQPASPIIDATRITGSVNYVGMAIKSAHISNPQSIHQTLLSRMLNTGFLWEEVRMKGGAYGAFVIANSLEQTFSMLSYRDPNSIETLKRYKQALQAYDNIHTIHDDLELNIIALSGQELHPQTPAQKNMYALIQLITGVTNQLRQENYETIINTQAKDIQKASQELFANMQQDHHIAILGNDDAFEALQTIGEVHISNL